MTGFCTDGHATAQQEPMVRKQLSPDFLDPAHEWRRLFAEVWGTFPLVVVAAGTVAAEGSLDEDDSTHTHEGDVAANIDGRSIHE